MKFALGFAAGIITAIAAIVVIAHAIDSADHALISH
jgi:hypothetical protein